MRIRYPQRNLWEWPGRDAWPFLLLLLAVLVPTGLLLWFMSDAIARQSAASRQTALEAYRGQLRLLRARTDSFWQPFAARLELAGRPEADKGPPDTVERHFEQLITEGWLDGFVVFDADGEVAFPHLVSGGRSAAADRQLLALQRLLPKDPARLAQTLRLTAVLNNYSVSIPPAQRLFLMGELRRMRPNVQLPTEEALRLSMQFTEGGTRRQPSGAFRPTLIPDVWALTSVTGRVVGLYRTRHLQALLSDALMQVAPRGVRFVTYSPDASGDPEAIAAGATLPGWQMSFVVLDNSAVDAAARARLMTYLWVGFAGIITMAVLGVVAGQTLGRQLRLARLKTDQVAAVSHELRAPLASVRVLVDGLLADQELEPVKTREYLELMAGEHARLTRVVENFLTFARFDRGRGRFVLVPTHPSRIVEASVGAIRERTPPGCDLRVDISDDLPRIMADADALGTALVNLLDNAVKFTPEDKHIVVRAYADKRSVMFAVRDNGTGIPVTEQRRIFRRFYRVDQRLARETAGVGLGLSIVALIVRAHGGQIEISSEPGAGSTFALRLPTVSGGRA